MEKTPALASGVAVVVLAGGRGRRIGGGKPFRMLGQQRLIDRAIERARDFSERVAVSVTKAGELADCAVPQIADPQPDWGALGGLAAGLDFAVGAGAELLLTLPCDSPFLPDDLLTRLRDALGPDQKAAIPASGDQLHVACGLWRVGVCSLLADYAAEGGRSLHGLAERVGFAEVRWNAQPLDPFFNINTEQDLEHAETILQRMQKILP
jgi:molybdopterin-guanine dinucleotide biosynthesis protein A